MAKNVNATPPPKSLGPIALLLITTVGKIAAQWVIDWFIKLISERNWFEGDEPTTEKVQKLVDEMIVATPRLFIRKRHALRALYHMAPKVVEKSLTAADKEELRGSFALPRSEK